MIAKFPDDFCLRNFLVSSSEFKWWFGEFNWWIGEFVWWIISSLNGVSAILKGLTEAEFQMGKDFLGVGGGEEAFFDGTAVNCCKVLIGLGSGVVSRLKIGACKIFKIIKIVLTYCEKIAFLSIENFFLN